MSEIASLRRDGLVQAGPGCTRYQLKTWDSEREREKMGKRMIGETMKVEGRGVEEG